MKETKRSFVPFLLSMFLLLVLLPAIAVANTEGDYDYVVTDEGVTITRYHAADQAASTSVAIPSKLGGESVTKIGAEAFCDVSHLTSVAIPDSVTVLERGAFQGCTSLVTVTPSDSLTTIGDGAFSG